MSVWTWKEGQLGAVDVGRVIEIAVLLVGLGIAWGTLRSDLDNIKNQLGVLPGRFSQIDSNTAESSREIQRIEDYLSFKDPGYWGALPHRGPPK